MLELTPPLQSYPCPLVDRLWLGLLANWELSHLFPFEGLNPALLVFGAWLFLKERVPLSGWIGIALISVGVALVSAS